MRDGLPLAVRVLDLVKGPRVIVNGQPSTHGFVATVGFPHPETGKVEVVAVKSNEFASSRKDAYDTPFKVGDDVTAVYLPGRLEKTLRLYSFLELSPDVNLRTSSTSREPSSPWRAVGVLLAVCGLLLVAFANVYAFGRYEPVPFEFRRAVVPFVAGAVVIGGGVFAALYLSHRREQVRVRERAIVAQATGKAVELEQPFLGHGLYGGILRVLLAAGSLLLGGVTAVCWCFMANAWLDRVSGPAGARYHRRHDHDDACVPLPRVRAGIPAGGRAGEAQAPDHAPASPLAGRPGGRGPCPGRPARLALGGDGHHPMTKGRLEAFSDGVIAILITIMVLELKVPDGDDWSRAAPA